LEWTFHTTSKKSPDSFFRSPDTDPEKVPSHHMADFMNDKRAFCVWGEGVDDADAGLYVSEEIISCRIQVACCKLGVPNLPVTCNL